MKSTKFRLAATALAFATAASAMPSAVTSSWWDRMTFRLGVMSDNAGFCSANPQIWIC